MKNEFKELLDEMIQYKLNRKPIKHLNQAFQKLGDSEIYSINGFLLQWHKEVFLKLAPPDKFEISPVLHRRYTALFENCPPLKMVFSLHDDYIGWAAELTNEEQNEVRNYIHENYKVLIRIRRYVSTEAMNKHRES